MNLDKELMIVLCIIIATFLLIGNYVIFLKMEKYEHVGDNWGQIDLGLNSGSLPTVQILVSLPNLSNQFP